MNLIIQRVKIQRHRAPINTRRQKETKRDRLKIAI